MIKRTLNPVKEQPAYQAPHLPTHPSSPFSLCAIYSLPLLITTTNTHDSSQPLRLHNNNQFQHSHSRISAYPSLTQHTTHLSIIDHHTPTQHPASQPHTFPTSNPMCTEIHSRFRRCTHTRLARWSYCSVLIPRDRTPAIGLACRRYKLRFEDNQNGMDCFECLR
jgi:hypothetical protein